MSELLTQAMDWVRGGSIQPEPAQITDLVMAEDARLLAEAFTGPDGERRLMVFARLSVLRPPVDHRLPAGAREAYAQLRQGQDSIFAALVHYLDLHQANQRTPDHERSIATEPRPDFGWSARTGAFSEGAGDERFGEDGTFDPRGLIAGG